MRAVETSIACRQECHLQSMLTIVRESKIAVGNIKKMCVFFCSESNNSIFRKGTRLFEGLVNLTVKQTRD